MALLNSLPPYPHNLAYRCAVDKSSYMSPSYWTRHVVTSTITDTGKFRNDLNHRCLLFPQEIDVLKADPPSYRACNHNNSPLVESTIERKRKRGPAKTELNCQRHISTSDLPRRTNVTEKQGAAFALAGRPVSLRTQTSHPFVTSQLSPFPRCDEC